MSNDGDPQAVPPPPAEGALRAAVRDVILAPEGITGRAEFVVRRIGQAISLGLLEIGEQLPSESEVAARLGVSPVTLREGLAILREAGYVETRRGRGGGTFVRRTLKPPPRKAARERLREYSVDALRDLSDFHAAVAGAATALAAERTSTEEIAQLRSHLEGMLGADSAADYSRADSRFHMEIAAAARSQRLTAAETAIQAELHELLSIDDLQAETIALSNREHGAILAAIESREVSLAQRLAAEHVRRVVKMLISERLAQLGG